MYITPPLGSEMSRKTMNKINILYVHNKTAISGGERSLLNLWYNLDRERFRPVLVVPSAGALSEEAGKLGVPAHHIYIPRLSFFNLFTIAKAFKCLLRIAKDEKADVIHSYSPRNNMLAWACAKTLGIRVIWHERNLIFGKEIDLTRRFISLPDAVICNSLAVAERFRRNGIMPSKVKVILNGVDLERFDPGMSGNDLKRELGAGDRKIVGLITNLSKRKRPEYFIEAASRVFRRHKDALFVIVGGEFSESETGRMSELRAKAVVAGLKDDLVFMGFKESVAPILAAFDVSVQVTEKEACSRAILESMAAGKPVVAVGGGGNPELIEDGVTGVLVAPDDPEGLADEISGLLQDDTRRQEMGRSARSRAEKYFKVESNTRETEKLYREMLVRARKGTTNA